MGFSRGIVHLFPDPAANSSTREDSSVFTPDSVDSPRVAQATVVQLRGVISSTQYFCLHVHVYLRVSSKFFPSFMGISRTPPPQCSGFTPGRCQGGVSRTGILCSRCRLPGSDGTGFNESCLRQKVGHFLYFVCRETDRSCLCFYREFGGLPIVFIQRS